MFNYALAVIIYVTPDVYGLLWEQYLSIHNILKDANK